MNWKTKVTEKGLKITWIAEKVGITRSLMSQYINLARPMPNHIEIKLKEILN